VLLKLLQEVSGVEIKREVSGVEIKRIDFFDKYQYMVMVIPPKYSISEVMGKLKS
jgi:putative transposase